ncbi:MAG TPA: prepilin-type N-terminal cleavage/methylation domain-containing protein [Nitriliruptorales bacterium]|nr:prepilin-type N-terminal cleavage/methylation domain-containing protein [Nitriliruptorales bacterium]
MLHGITREEAGISLVEMMIGLFILAVVLAALANTTITSLASIADDERRSWANQVAGEMIEQLQSREWSGVGFYQSDAASSAEGAPVVIGDVRPASQQGTSPHPDGCTYAEAASADATPLPFESVERQGTCYDLQRHIVWDADSDGNDFKRFVVEVSWQLRGRTLSIRQSATRAPDPGNLVRFFSVQLQTSTDKVAYTTNASTGTTTASPPSLSFVATSSAPAVSSPSVKWIHPSDGSVNDLGWVPTSADGGLTWTFGPNSSMLPSLPEGDVQFYVVAQALDTVATAESEKATIRFSYDTTASIAVNSFTLTQTKANGTSVPPICVNASNFKPQPSLVIDANIKGLSSGDNSRVKFRWTGQTTPVLAAYQAPNGAGDGAVFRLTINNNFTFTPGSTVTFEVWLDDALFWTGSTSYAVTGSGVGAC